MVMQLMEVFRTINVDCFAKKRADNVVSNSQSVFPIMNDKALFGVLDIDSPLNKRIEHVNKSKQVY